MSSASRSAFSSEGATRCKASPDPGLAHPEASLVIRPGKVGLVRPLEVRNVVTAQLDQSPPPQLVEGLHDAGRSQVDRAKSTHILLVPGVTRPPVVECCHHLVDDLADRPKHTVRIPGRLDELFVRIGLEEHPARLAFNTTATLGCEDGALLAELDL